MPRYLDPLTLSHDDYMEALENEDDTDDSHLFDNTDYDPEDDRVLEDEDDEYDVKFEE